MTLSAIHEGVGHSVNRQWTETLARHRRRASGFRKCLPGPSELYAYGQLLSEVLAAHSHTSNYSELINESLE
jgi:hypothetical protein